MKISHFLKVMAVVTFMAVLYIHLQMKIYDLAYQSKVNQQKIDQLAEINTRVKNDILRLRSSDNIGRSLLGKDSNYQFVGRNRIVEVADERPSWPGVLTSSAEATGGFFSRVMSLAFSPDKAALSH